MCNESAYLFFFSLQTDDAGSKPKAASRKRKKSPTYDDGRRKGSSNLDSADREDGELSEDDEGSEYSDDEPRDERFTASNPKYRQSVVEIYDDSEYSSSNSDSQEKFSG